MQHGENKADGVTAKGNQDVRKNGMRGTTAGTEQKGNGDGFFNAPAVHGMDAAAVVMGAKFQVPHASAGCAAPAFRGKAFQGMADQVRVRDPHGCEGMIQGLQNEHGFSLAARKRGMTADASTLSDGSRGRLDLLGCGRLRLYKVNELPNYGNRFGLTGQALDCPRSQAGLCNLANHRDNRKSIWKQW